MMTPPIGTMIVFRRPKISKQNYIYAEVPRILAAILIDERRELLLYDNGKTQLVSTLIDTHVYDWIAHWTHVIGSSLISSVISPRENSDV